MNARELNGLINLAFAAGGLFLAWKLLQSFSVNANAPDFIKAARSFLDPDSAVQDATIPEQDAGAPSDEPPLITMKRGKDGVFRPCGCAK